MEDGDKSMGGFVGLQDTINSDGLAGKAGHIDLQKVPKR